MPLNQQATLYFNRQLKYFKEKVMEEAAVRHVFSAIPMSTEVSPTAKTYTQTVQSRTGQAAWIHEAGHDIPMANVGNVEEEFPVQMLGIGYSYTEMELERAAMTPNINLSVDRAAASNDAALDKHNDVGMYGDQSVGLYGLLDYPTVPLHGMTYALDGSDGATVAQMLGQLVDVYSSIIALNKGNDSAKPTVLALPPDEYTFLMLTDRGANNDTTIGEFIESKFKVRLESWWELEGAGDNGEDLFLFYNPIPQNLTYEVPGGRVWVQKAPQLNNFEYKVLAYGLSGGTHIKRPLKMAIGVLPTTG